MRATFILNGKTYYYDIEDERALVRYRNRQEILMEKTFRPFIGTQSALAQCVPLLEELDGLRMRLASIIAKAENK